MKRIALVACVLATLAGGSARADILTQVAGDGVTTAFIGESPEVVHLAIDAVGHCCVGPGEGLGVGNAEITRDGKAPVTVRLLHVWIIPDEMRAKGVGSDGGCWAVTIRDYDLPLSDHATIVRTEGTHLEAECVPPSPLFPVFGNYVFTALA